MKFITGWNEPVDELGPVAAWKRPRSRRRTRRSLLSWPKTSDRSSGADLLDEAVQRAGPLPWAANWVCERRAMKSVVTIADGTTSSEMMAEERADRDMMISTPTTVRMR